jgi:heptosyltransferase-3
VHTTRTILILHAGALGDLLLALPAIRALRKAFPDHEMGLLAGGEAARLLQACGEVQSVFPIERGALAELLLGIASLQSEMRRWLQRCDLAVGWIADPDHRLRFALARAGVARIVIGSSRSLGPRETHQQDRLLEMLAAVVPGNIDGHPLVLPPGVLAQAQRRLGRMAGGKRRKLAVCHPGSGSPHKCVEPAVFVELIQWCAANDWLALLMGGPADDEKVTEVLRRCRPPIVVQHEPLLAVAGLLAQTNVFIGHDSGLTHLAASLHVPTVALFGPTDVARWAPRGQHVAVLSGRPCECRRWEDVQACQSKPCLRISAQEVIQASQTYARVELTPA